jgi:hypothetical protein
MVGGIDGQKAKQAHQVGKIHGKAYKQDKQQGVFGEVAGKARGFHKEQEAAVPQTGVLYAQSGEDLHTDPS